MTALRTMRSTRGLILCLLTCYLLLVAGTFIKIRLNNDGHFFYALDDPYIHLALSEQLANGHYGLNPGEATSPSSSILWPFLLVPFAGHSVHAYSPLFWNVLFGAIAACLIGAIAAKLPLDNEDSSAAWGRRLGVAVLLMFTANLVSLTFVGMEHVLQVLLSTICVAGLLIAWDERRIPIWCLAAAAVGPMVRYENIAITVAVCVVLMGLRQWRKAVGLFVVAVLPMAAFSLFLHSRGLPALPLSVMVKGRATDNGGSIVGTVLRNFVLNLHTIADKPIYWPIIAMGAVLVWRCVRERNEVHRSVMAAGALVAALQVAVGRFGWFNRYEIYALIFVAVIFVRVVGVTARASFVYPALALFLVAAPYVEGTRSTAGATRELYEQQYQMHRFLNEYYQGKGVAVNDLGLVSYRRRPGLYVLDVYGLASPEAAMVQHKTSAWLKGIVDRHDVDLTITYGDWFRVPSAWTPLAKMCNSAEVMVVAERCVMFYSTQPGTRAELEEEMARFAPTVPQGVTVQLNPPGRGNGVGPQMMLDK